MRFKKLLPMAVLGTAAMSACQDAPLAPGPRSPGTSVDAHREKEKEKVSVCHNAAADGDVIRISPAALGAHLRHGDYAAGLVVSKEIGNLGDGVHFARITDALAAARASRVAHEETAAASCRITIAVGAGVFTGSAQASTDPTFERFPLTIDVPDITIEGAFRMQVDADGRATDASDGPELTALAASPGLKSPTLAGVSQSQLAEPMFIVTDAVDGPGGAGAVIEGFVFRSGNEAATAANGGNAVYALRARGLVIRGNRIEAGFSEPLQLSGSSAHVLHNHIGGKRERCTLCLAGPGDFRIAGNRILGSGLDAIFITPISDLRVPPSLRPRTFPVASAVTATVTNNDIRGFQAAPSGVALRLGALGVRTAQVIGSVRVRATDNQFIGNTFGVVVEGAFPVAGMGNRGDVSLKLRRNVIQSCQSDLLVAFTRYSTALGVTTGSVFQTAAWLQGSAFELDLGRDIAWSDAWYAHPAGFANALVVNGQIVPNGIHVAYDPTRACPV